MEESKKKTRTQKPRRVKPSKRAKKAFVNLIKSGGKNKKKALLDAGYSLGSANTPGKVLNSQSFQALLAEQGLSDEALNAYLADDIENKPQNRFKELELAYKLRGRIGNQNTSVEIGQVQVLAIPSVLLDKENIDPKNPDK